jgi:peptidoglycan/LPS O-acetylase OafA/YrhL
MTDRRFNWPIWTGLLLSLIAFISYFTVFVSFPVTRDFPWVNLLLFAAAAALLVVGVRRAYAADRTHPKRSKIMGTVVATLSFAIFGFFIFAIFIMARQLPASHGAPQVGQKAPDFSLSDIRGKPVSLSGMMALPVNGKAGSPNPRGVLLVFYRGYW